MAEYGSTWEREDLGGGQFRHTQHLRPIAYFQDGLYRPMNTSYADSGIGARPHIVTDAPLMVSTGDGGTRRIHPTRELDVWAEIGRPYNVSTRQPYPLNAFTRSGNLLTSTNTLADIHVWHGGHFSKLGIRLKSTWRTNPPAQFAFPVGLNGLTWSAGGILRKDGAAVMHLTAPHVYDFNNPNDIRPIEWEFTTLGGQTYVVFTLPTNMASSPMAVPIVDPTLTLQPNATDGIDTRIIGSGVPFNTRNYGVATVLSCGNAGTFSQRPLLKFPISLPGATASAATLSLYATADNSSNARTHRVFRQKRAWTEGTGNDTASGDGATWVTYDGTNNWQTQGGFGANDCEQTDIGSRAFTATETLNEFKDFSLTVAAVQEWIDGVFTNNGVLMKPDTENEDQYIFASSDHADADKRPKLTIDYTQASGALLKRMMYHAARRRS